MEEKADEHRDEGKPEGKGGHDGGICDYGEGCIMYGESFYMGKDKDADIIGVM